MASRVRPLRFPLLIHRLAGLALVLLAGCGGGGHDATPSTAVALGPAAYREPLSITVTGDASQASGLSVAAEHCDGMARVQAAAADPAGTSRFQCTPTVVGGLTLTVRDAAGQQVATQVVQVPLPQATLATESGT